MRYRKRHDLFDKEKLDIPLSHCATSFDAVIEGDPDRVRSPYRDGIKSLAAVLAAVASASNDGLPVGLAREPYVAD